MTVVAELELVARSSRNSRRCASGGALGLLQVAELGLGQLALGDLAEAELDGRVAVALGVADRGDAGRGRPRSRSRARASPSSVKTWVIPSFLPRIAGIVAPLRAGSRRRRRPAACSIRCSSSIVFGVGSMDVDQPLVGADLEVLARVLVLERRADHAVDVLLGRQRHGARRRSRRCAAPSRRSRARRDRWRRGRTP